MKLSLLALALVLPAAAVAVSPPPARPSVILISIDTLRADHLSSYGYSKIRTPHIDSFADGGTRFTQAEAQIPLTLPSHTSLFTSTYPFENQVEENGERVPAGVVTLASVLRAHGYKTAAFIGSEFLDRRYGLDQGFDEYDSPFSHQAEGVENPLALSLRRDGALVLRAARLWMEDHDGASMVANSAPALAQNTHAAPPVFVFVHLFDLHLPYGLPASVAEKQGISRYDAELEYVDQVLGAFRLALEKNGWWRNSLVVVFGDHGEGLGDHRETDHGYYIYESTLHVPLLVHWPEGVQFPPRVDAPVGLIDVAPTILDELHIPVPPSFEGQSVLGMLAAGREAPAPRPVYGESVYAYDAFGWAPLRALRLGKYKYIQAPKAELYNLESDPHEQLNLLPRNGAVAAELRNRLADVLARFAPAERAAPPALSPETLAELESLGYLAASSRHDSTAEGRNELSLPDPKDRFAEFALYQTAFVSLTEGNAAAALPKFQSIIKSDPQNTLARFHLGECYLQTRHPQDALQEWDAVLKLNPQYAPAAQSIGQYWLAAGDYTKARRRFQQVLALTPESFSGHFQLAVADEHLGLLPEARQNLETACKIAPHDENCARELKALSPK